MRKLIRIGSHGHFIVVNSDEQYNDRGDFICNIKEIPSRFSIGLVIDNDKPSKVVYGDITTQFSGKREDCLKITHSTKTGLHPKFNQSKAEELLGKLDIIDISEEVFNELLN